MHACRPQVESWLDRKTGQPVLKQVHVLATLDWENVSTVRVCQFYLEECPSNCIVIMKSLFEGRCL